MTGTGGHVCNDVAAGAGVVEFAGHLIGAL